jgi:hypothetical protein
MYISGQLLLLLVEMHKAKLIDIYSGVVSSSGSPERGKCKCVTKRTWRNAINEHKNASRVA